ncbi:DUF6381 family protein [Streptomyces sp. NPDC048142]|uniref:DUF6381 family protein n=1 Tax=Streptomyces sp. NPDC048142 TaxID=3365501 RepID=UPI0037227687
MNASDQPGSRSGPPQTMADDLRLAAEHCTDPDECQRLKDKARRIEREAAERRLMERHGDPME